MATFEAGRLQSNQPPNKISGESGGPGGGYKIIGDKLI